MSTLKVTNIESPSGGGVNAKITDINGGQLSNRNLIINGAMQVAQRGTTSTSSGYHTLDRWKIETSGGTIAQSQHTLSSTDDPYTKGFRSSLHLNVNSAGGDAAADFLYITQFIEAQNIAQSGWNYTSSSSYITLSFNVKSSLAGTYYIYLRAHDATNRAYVKAFTLAANTWSEVTCTVPGDSTLVFNDDNNTGLEVGIRPYVGTNYSDSGVSAGVWFTRSGSFQTPDYAQNFVNTSSATFEITGVQLEVGEVATAFEHRSFGDELLRCQRYYYRVNATSLFTPYGTGHNRTTSAGRAIVKHPVRMRTAPSSMDFSNLASGVLGVSDVLATSAAINTDGNGTDTTTIDIGSSSAFTTGMFTLMSKNTTSSHIGFSAEL